MKNFEWYGRLPRSAPRQSSEKKDMRFLQFVKDQWFLKVPEDVWRIPAFSAVAQYDEFSKFLLQKPSLAMAFSKELVQEAAACVSRHFSFFMRNCGFLTWDESWARMRKTASCGFPDNILYYSKQNLHDHGDWLSKYIAQVDSWKTDRPLPVMFQQNAKWELRKVGKSTRTFLPGPANLHMFQVQKFSQQNDALVASNQSTWFGCGLSPFKGGWNNLYTSLLRFGTEFFESDVSGWDRSVSADLRWKICELRFTWLPMELQTLENFRMIFTSYDLAINAFVVLEDGDVTRKYGGTSSGEYNTLDDNCLVHCFVCFLIILWMAQNARVKIAYEEIVRIFKMKFVGDDNLGAVKVLDCPWFTWEMFQRGYELLGFKIKYIRHSAVLMEREFLSLRFTRRHGMVLGEPDMTKILCSLVYGNHYDDVQYRLLRALDFRMYVYPNAKLYALVNEWCETLYRENKIMCEREDTDFPWSTIRGNWHSLGALMVLHCGYE